MKRNRRSLKCIVAELLCTVLTAGMLSGAAPMNVSAEEDVYAEENVSAENGPEDEAVQPEESDPSFDAEAGDDEIPTDEDTIVPEEEIMLLDADSQAAPFADHAHGDITFAAWERTDSLPDTAGNYYLTGNVTLSDSWEVPTGEVCLCLNGKTISLAETPGAASCVIFIGKNSHVYLYDCAGGGKITGGTDSGIRNNGSFDMYAGEISGNSSAVSGGGVWNDGMFCMHAGKIANNRCENDSVVDFPKGGGVYNEGTYLLLGGEIGDNTAVYGGGVYNSGTFSMHNGTITSNISPNQKDMIAGCGGGVYSDGTFYMYDGIVCKNAAYLGGGVFNRNSFVMRGGKITENKDSVIRFGGGVQNDSGTFDMYNGEISDNASSGQGGGVQNRGIFNLYDGSIMNNRTYTHVGSGGGVSNEATFRMYGGKISGNQSSRHGGGVCNYVEFYMSGGEISGNRAGDQGGGVSNGATSHKVSTFIVGGEAAINGNQDSVGTSNVSLYVEYGTVDYDTAEHTIITVDKDNPLSGSAGIGITISWHPLLSEGTKVSISAPNDADYSAFFYSDDPKYEIQTGENHTLLLVAPSSHTHQWSPDWSNNGTHHWHDCTVSGCPVTDNAGKDGYGVHTEDAGTITKQPTETEEGVRTYYCSICGYEMRTESIPADGTGGGETPDPGNGNQPEGGGDEGGQKPDDKPAGMPPAQADVVHDEIENAVQDAGPDTPNEIDTAVPVKENSTPDGTDTAAQPQDAEPKTGNAVSVELYATLSMISGLTYLLLYFADRSGGMTEETKKELVSKLIRWAKHGGTIRRLFALGVIFVVLVYYHSIGKQNAVGLKEAC